MPQWSLNGFVERIQRLIRNLEITFSRTSRLSTVSSMGIVERFESFAAMIGEIRAGNSPPMFSMLRHPQ